MGIGIRVVGYFESGATGELVNSSDLPSDGQIFTLMYRLERRELMKWYWWAWCQPRGLWSYWLVVWLAVVAVCYFFRVAVHPRAPVDLALFLAIAFGICVFFILYPQIMYKARERVLRATEVGLDTSIGAVSGNRSWKDIASITDRGSYIAITVAGGIPLGFFWLRTFNGNAFIIPNRAFGGSSERLAFLETIRTWHAKHALSFPRLSRRRYYR